MESMDHEQALALLGLSGPAEPDDIEARYAERRRVLERRWVTSHSQAEKRVLEAQMRELDAARDSALSQQGIISASAPAGAKVHFKAGTVLADRYVVRSKLGFGPRAAVFRALDLTLGRDVAVKVIAPQLLLVPGAAKRLAQVIERTYGFAHSGIVNIYATVATAAYTLVAMELVEGPTLAERSTPLAWSQPKSAAEILKTMAEIGAALKYAAPKCLHLNLTPHNVIIAADDSVKLTDFSMNIAVPVLVGAAAAQNDDLCFVAPEVQAMLRQDTPDVSNIDARADQYAVAAIAYLLATSAAPVPGRKPLGQMRIDLPEHFVTAVERALALAPEARFDTFDDFLTAASRPVRKPMSPVMRLVAAAGVAGVLGVAAVAGFAVAERRFGPVNEWLPGGRALAAKREQAEALQARTASLRTALTDAQRRLQRRNMDARMTLATVEQLAGEGERPDAALPSLADARRNADMLQALGDMVTPKVFNGADVLNAYNLAGLGDEHMERGRHDEAIGVLTSAEAVLSGKLRDLKQAEVLIEQRFGVTLPLSDDAGDTAAKLKQEWLAMTEQRRQFAAAVKSGMVMIPGGSFVMGDIAGSGAKSELPVRMVQVPAFEIARYEVTQREYAACVAVGACAPDRKVIFKPGAEDLPVAGISWLDAQQYVDWLRVKTGEDYRLPSEAEWEYAARAGVADAYPWGERVGRGLANCLDCGSAWDGSGPSPVGSFAANGFGLHDMTGNVWEWTGDCWYRDYTSAPDAAAPRDGGESCDKRVLRGGSWGNAAWLARVSYRAFASANTRHELYGFRIAKSVE